MIRRLRMSKEEAEGRVALMHEHYTGTVLIEAQCMATMMRTQILPVSGYERGEETKGRRGGKAAYHSRALL